MRKFDSDWIVSRPSCCRVTAAASISPANRIPRRTTGNSPRFYRPPPKLSNEHIAPFPAGANASRFASESIFRWHNCVGDNSLPEVLVKTELCYFYFFFNMAAEHRMGWRGWIVSSWGPSQPLFSHYCEGLLCAPSIHHC